MARAETSDDENSREVFFWYFMRLSGVVLIFMALFHFVLTHIVNDVTETGAEFIDSRWSNPFWRFYDWLMLSLALLHGTNGLRIIAGDVVRSDRRRRIVLGVAYALVSTLGILGTITILTFRPS